MNYKSLHDTFLGAAVNLSEQFQPVEGENPFGSRRSKPGVQLAGVGGEGMGGAPATRQGPGFELLYSIL